MRTTQTDKAEFDADEETSLPSDQDIDFDPYFTDVQYLDENGYLVDVDKTQ